MPSLNKLHYAIIYIIDNIKFKSGLISIILGIISCAMTFPLSYNLGNFIILYFLVLSCTIGVLLFPKRQLSVHIEDFIIFLYVLIFICRNHSITNINFAIQIGLVIFYCLLRIGSIQNYKSLYNLTLFSCIILALIGYLQYFEVITPIFKRYKILGPFRNPALYAGFLSLLLVIIFSFCIITQRNNRDKTLFFISVSIIIFTLPIFILANSRTSWLTLILPIFYVLYKKLGSKYWEKINYTKKLLLILFVSISIINICYYIYLLRPNSVKGRILIWKISTEMVVDRPIWGFGTNGFNSNYLHYQQQYFANKRGSNNEIYLADNTHFLFNEPLRILIEYGIIGFSLYVIFCLSLFKSKGSNDLINTICKATLFGYFVFGMFSYPKEGIQLQAILILLTTINLKQRKLTFFSYTLTSKYCRIRQTILLVVSLLFISMLSTMLSKYTSFWNIEKSNKYTVQNKLQIFKKLNQKLYNDHHFLARYCEELEKGKNDSLLLDKICLLETLFPTNILYIMKGNCLKRMGRYKEAEQNYWYAHFMIPSRQKPRALLAELYYQTNRKKKAKKIALKVLQEKVKVYGFETYVIHERLQKILHPP